MKGGKIAGIVLVIIGAIGLIVSLLTDVISIGIIGASPGFGTYQIIGTALGVILIGVGLFLMVKR